MLTFTKKEIEERLKIGGHKLGLSTKETKLLIEICLENPPAPDKNPLDKWVTSNYFE